MSTLIIGLSISMLLYILAAGLTLIFGMLNVVNFAHGAFYMLGAFLAYQAVVWSGEIWWALLLAPLIVGAVGALMEVFTLRPIYPREHHFQLLITFGAVLVLDEAVRLVWGINYKAIQTPALLSGSFSLLGGEIAFYRVFVIILGLAIAASLSLVISGTQIGAIVRAASANPAMTQCLGIDVKKVRTRVFVLGTALAGLAGVISAPMFPVLPGMGLSIILDCFMVVVIGGLGSMSGVFVGALIIGLSRAFGQQWIPEWISVLTYLLFVAVLLLRPQGLLARKGRQA